MRLDIGARIGIGLIVIGLLMEAIIFLARRDADPEVKAIEFHEIDKGFQT